MILPIGPSFQSTVSVSMLIAGYWSYPSVAPFLDPVLPGHESIQAPIHSFYIEHKGSPTNATNQPPRRVMFDVGLRTDFTNLAPAAFAVIHDNAANMTVYKDIPTQLREGGIDLNTVEAMIWSHSHSDHIGDPSKWPNTTQLVVGQGTKAAFLPGYPGNPNSTLLETDVANRTMTEINFDESKLNIGGFRAHDYFGDGSLYLLDVPGHVTGHMGVLARVGVSPDSFIFLGGDACHHPGQFRPSVNLAHNFPCPASIRAQHPISPKYFGGERGADLGKRTNPLLTLHASPGISVYQDPAAARRSAGQMADAFDGSRDVFVALAHDSSLVPFGRDGVNGTSPRGTVRLFPETMDKWREQGWKERTSWSFVERSNPAYRFRPTNETNVV